MTPRRRIGLLVGGPLVLAAIVGSLVWNRDSTSTPGEHIVGGGVTMVDADYRKPAPDLSGELLSGGRFSFGDYRDKVVVLNFWGSWCGPCNREAPMLRTLSQELAPRGVSFVGIDLREVSRAAAQSFLRSYGIDYPNIYDPPGRSLVDFSPAVPGNPPNTLVLDRQGRVAVRVTGETSASTLRPLIEGVLAESGS